VSTEDRYGLGLPAAQDHEATEGEQGNQYPHSERTQDRDLVGLDLDIGRVIRVVGIRVV
jgi:hypothetical protein